MADYGAPYPARGCVNSVTMQLAAAYFPHSHAIIITYAFHASFYIRISCSDIMHSCVFISTMVLLSLEANASGRLSEERDHHCGGARHIDTHLDKDQFCFERNSANKLGGFPESVICDMVQWLVLRFCSRLGHSIIVHLFRNSTICVSRVV